MGRRKGSQTGVYSHGTMRRWKDGCRCEECAQAHEKHLQWFREYQKTRKRHGLTFAERQVFQAPGCWACGSRDELVVDHDHSHCPGRFGCEDCFRGMLCADCNRILGMARDDPARLLNLVRYLEHNGTSDHPGEVTHIWGAASSGS